ncbi:MAG TPA: hypothetical protein VH228_06175 [Nocardioides sp.]|jgi:hypothetical protein|nr:hypothetical protein [Nocardioides sp.]
MYVARMLRMSAAAVAAVLAVGTIGATAAEAGKPPAAPTGLSASVTPHQNGTYDVAASWNAVASATSYRVALTKGGTTLSTATVTATSWAPTVTATPGNASLSVRAVVGKRPGKTATLTVPLADVTPPTGAFHATWDNNTQVATITVTTPVADNSGGAVTAKVNWDSENSSSTESWNLASDITHTYPPGAGRYVPVVTLTDSSSNSVDVPVNAVVIMDSEAPTGSFSVAPPTGWAAFTKVTVTQDGDLADNWSPADKISRSVDWGDGSASQTWTTGTTLSHRYATAGSYTPVVTITDEANNPSLVSTSEVVVTADTTRPVVKLTLPKAKHSVRAWRTLRGTATDGQTGVKSVWLKAVEKRGTAWYGYNRVTHAWVKSTTKAKAFSKAKAFALTTTATHVWSAKLVKLGKGTLVYKVRATDQVKNVSRTLTHTATLTKR